MAWNQSFEQKRDISKIDVNFGVISTNVIMKIGVISLRKKVLWEEKGLKVEPWRMPTLKKDDEDLSV